MCWWMYSIGSSIVRMCSRRSVLILSIIAASVVDLPLPVGPVTSTRPRGRSASVAMTGGSAELVERLDLLGDDAVDGRDGAALVEHVAAEAREAADAEREVELQRLLEALLLRVGQHAVGQRLRLGRPERRQVERLQLAVHADLRRRLRRQVQVGSARPRRASSTVRAMWPYQLPASSSQLSAPSSQLSARKLALELQAHFTVSRATSSIVVTPSMTLCRPLRRSVIIPSSTALRRSSSPEAPTRISSRSSSPISMTS